MSASRIVPADEVPHEAGAEPAWSESWYFTWLGEERSGIARMANRPNEGTQDALVVELAPEVSVLREVREERDNSERLEVGGVSFACASPLEHWRVRAPGLELDFRAETPGGEAWMAGDKGAVKSVARGHFEQAGSMTGTVHGEPFSGRGYRDKSWGVRDWSAPDLWRWFCLPFAADLSVNALVVEVAGRRFSGGWAWSGGELVPVGEVALDTDYEADGTTQRALELSVTVAGEPALFSADVKAVASLPIPDSPRGTVVNEGLARWRSGDGRETLGIAEYLHQADGGPDR